MRFNNQPPRGFPGRGQGGGFERDQKSLDQIWPGYLKEGYFDAQGNLRLEYVSRDNMKPLTQGMAEGRPALTTNQLRRYFGHCRMIETKIRAKNATWQQLRSEFLKLDITAADAIGRDTPKIPKLFHDFIRRNVSSVKNEKDFLEGFLPHFEALVGFGSTYFRNERR